MESPYLPVRRPTIIQPALVTGTRKGIIGPVRTAGKPVVKIVRRTITNQNAQPARDVVEKHSGPPPHPPDQVGKWIVAGFRSRRADEDTQSERAQCGLVPFAGQFRNEDMPTR